HGAASNPANCPRWLPPEPAVAPQADLRSCKVKEAPRSTYPHTPQPLSTPLLIYEKERPERWSERSIGPEGPEVGMDVTVPKKELLRLVGRCQGVADKKSTMPALSNVLLSINGPSELRVAATDLYLAVSGTAMGVDVKKGGSVAVPAKDLYER